MLANDARKFVANVSALPAMHGFNLHAMLPMPAAQPLALTARYTYVERSVESRSRNSRSEQGEDVGTRWADQAGAGC